MNFPSKTAEAFRKARASRGLNTGQLARLAGFRNATKGARRIQEFERSGQVTFELLGKLASALDLPGAEVNSWVAQDRDEYYRGWLDWVNAPPRPYLVLRVIATMYSGQLVLPDSIQNRAEAEVYASRYIADRRTRGCLVWTRKLTIWFRSNGSIENVTQSSPGKLNAPSGTYTGSLPRSLGQSYLFDLSRSGEKRLPE